ncbi:MAG: hypothetical protein MHM6MM_000407 [Cercozoa sp. M6MM]
MVTPRATSPRTLHVRNNPVRSPRSSRRLRSQSVDVERCGMGTRDNLVVDFERLDTLQEPNAERGGIWGWSFAVPDMVNGAWKWTKGRARRVQHGYAEFKRSIDGRPVDDGINTVPMRPVLNIEVMNVRAMMVILAVTYFFAIGATVFAFMERGLRVDDSRRFSVSRTQWLECSELPLAELQSRGMHKVVGMFNDTCGSQPSAYAWTQMSTMIAAVELDIALRATPIALSATSHLGSNHTLREAFHLALAVFDDESDEAGRTGLVRDYRATESWEQSLGERGEHCRHKAEDVEGLLRCRTQTLASPKDGFDEVLWQNSLRSRLGDRISDHRKRTRWDIYFVVPVSSIDGVGYDATLHNLDLHVKTQSRDFERYLHTGGGGKVGVMVVFGVEFLSSVVQTSQGSDDDARGSSHTHPLAAAFLLCVYAWCLSLVMAPLPRGRASRWLQIGSLRSAAVAERRRNLNVRLLHRLVHVSWQAYCHPPAAPDEQHTEWGEIELSPYDLRLTDYEQVDDGKYAWLLAEPTLQDVESASCSSSSGSEFAQSVERQRSNRNNNNNNTRNNNNRNNNTEDEKEEAGELRLQLRRQRSFDGTNEVILAFRGTTSADNLKTDLRFKRRRVHLDFFRTGVDAGELPGEDKDLWDPRQTVRLHSGFFEAWKNVRRSLMPRFERLLDTTPDAIITATGHSMGGVFAVFAVLECCMRLRMPVKSCITFGSPRCGDADFAEFADRTLGKNVHLRVVYRQDTVSHLPFTQLGYMHAGREIVIDRVGNALFDLDLDFGALDRLLAGCRGSLSHHILDNYVDGIEAMKLLMEEQQQDRVRDLLDHLADGRTAGDADYPEDRVAGQSIELTTCSEVPGDDDMDDETRRNRFLTISSPLRHLAHFRPSVRRRLFVDPSLAEEDSEPGSCRTASVSPASCRSGSGTPVEIDLFARPNSDSVGTVVAPASHDVRLSIESQQLDVRFVHGRLPNRRISV